MNWSSIARKEYAQAIRWRGLWALFVIAVAVTFLGWGVSGGILNPRPELLAAVGPDILLGALQYPVSLFVSLAGLLVAYQALTSHQGDGSLRLLAAQPHTRADIVLGTMTGRSAAVWSMTGLLFLVTAVASVVLYGVFDPVRFVLAALVTALYVLVVVSFGTGVSAVARSRTVGGVAIAVYYLFLNVLWESVFSTTVYTELFGTYNEVTPPASRSLFLVSRAVPTDLYDVLLNSILGIPNTTSAATIAVLEPLGDPFAVLSVGDAFGTTPLLLGPGGALLLLVGWGAIPLLIGYVFFDRRVDL